MARILALILLFASAAWAGVVEDVRDALSQNNAPVALAALNSHKAQHGVDPEYLEGLSWMARFALSARDYNQAWTYAKQTETQSLDLLKHRSLDAEPHLPLALGAAYEVEGQVLAARGENSQAVAVLQSALHAYGTTSMRARLQKNLNLLALVGKPAPALALTEHFGPAPKPLAQLKGSPALLFFWAHWCVDCKGEGPIITRLRSEYASKGLAVMAPTQRYGYAANGNDATPAQELAYIKTTWQHYYAGLQDVPVPVSKANFNVYGASTTPTLVLVDRNGHVAMYHPGAMSYDDLRSAIDKVMAN
jgi:thiol-disulfide isomerase/thioredoxin